MLRTNDQLMALLVTHFEERVFQMENDVLLKFIEFLIDLELWQDNQNYYIQLFQIFEKSFHQYNLG